MLGSLGDEMSTQGVTSGTLICFKLLLRNQPGDTTSIGDSVV